MLKRSKYIGDKKSIFLIRHENDLDFMLPILLYASNPIVFLWGVIKEDDFRLRFLKKHNVKYTVLNGVYKSIPERLFSKLFKIVNRNLYKKYIVKLNDKKMHEIVASFAQELKGVNASQVDKVIFDHTINTTVEMMIGALRKWKKENLKIYSLPHAYGVFANKMFRYSMISPHEIVSDWDVFDNVVSFNENQAMIFKDVSESKKSILPSLRNTKEWVSVLRNEIQSGTKTKALSQQNNGRVNFLIIHSLMTSNINEHELERCVRILDQFGCYDVRIKPHPRRVGDALKLAENSKSTTLINDHITECIHWADYVLFFHSSAVYDAFLLEKTVFYPNYASSSKLDDNVLKQCLIFNTPDEFYYAAKAVADGEVLSPPKHTVPKWDDLVDEWGRIVN